MGYKELVERLNEWNENLISQLCADDVLTCDDLCGCTKDCIVVQAATAITDLLARAEAAEAWAEKAERERGAAISDLTYIARTYPVDLCDDLVCQYCKHHQNVNTGCPGWTENDCFEWRGKKEE